MVCWKKGSEVRSWGGNCNHFYWRRFLEFNFFRLWLIDIIDISLKWQKFGLSLCLYELWLKLIYIFKFKEKILNMQLPNFLQGVKKRPGKQRRQNARNRNWRFSETFRYPPYWQTVTKLFWLANFLCDNNKISVLGQVLLASCYLTWDE